MKRLLIFIFIAATSCITANAQRYLTQIFTDAQITYTPNIVYANNFSFLTGAPVATDLYMDLYAPNASIDPGIKPLIVYLHTGSFLPTIVNGTPTGNKTDSATVEMCRQFAKRGYVVAAMSYRVGWNPIATYEGIRTGTLLNAVYRSLQDVKCCVRFLNKSVISGNPYLIDSSKIVLCGQGSGGYVALAYATLDKTAEINLPKFLADSTVVAYGFVQGQSYVNPAVSGDFDGYGGVSIYNNPNNSVGFSSKVHFVINLGGALADSSWLEPGDAPMTSLHVMGDPFAPYGDGPVIVPTTGGFVVNVSGSKTVVTKANAIGNNNCFINAGFTDPYTLRANQLNIGQDGLFPFDMNPPTQAGPWEWFDLQATRNLAQLIGYPPSEGDSVYNDALLTNPNMSKAKALAHIDTIQNYVNPRIVYCLGLLTSINDNSAVAASIVAMPNPSNDGMNIELRQRDNQIVSIELFDITGRIINHHDGIATSTYRIARKGIEPGIYIARVRTEKGEASIRICFN